MVQGIRAQGHAATEEDAIRGATAMLWPVDDRPTPLKRAPIGFRPRMVSSVSLRASTGAARLRSLGSR